MANLALHNCLHKLKNRILIVGAGGHGQAIAGAIQQANNDQVPVGYVDSNPELKGQERLGVPILGTLDDIPEVVHDELLIGIGNNQVRQDYYEALLSDSYRFATVVDSRAIVASDARIHPGTVVLAGAIISVGVQVGPNVIINSGAVVDHHSHIEAHVHVAQGAVIGGDVVIGVGAKIGLGAAIESQSSILPWSNVAAGTVISNKGT